MFAKVAIIEGIPGAFNAIQRKAGFEDAAKQYKLDVVTSQSGQSETATANKVAAGIIIAYPDLAAFMCSNDNMALGVVSALRAADKEGKIKVVGFDNISAVQQLIKAGKVLATADQHADQLAVFGIQYALEALKTNQIPTQDKETPVDLITAAGSSFLLAGLQFRNVISGISRRRDRRCRDRGLFANPASSTVRRTVVHFD
jgi:ribose transport system substrate-binding protein